VSENRSLVFEALRLKLRISWFSFRNCSRLGSRKC